MQDHSAYHGGLLCKGPVNKILTVSWLRSTSFPILWLVAVATSLAFGCALWASDSSDSPGSRLAKTGNHVSASGPTHPRDAKPPILNSHSDERGRFDLRNPVFIENQGQFDEKVRFRVVGNGAGLWLTDQGIVFDFVRRKNSHELLLPEAGGAFNVGRRDGLFGRKKSDSHELERIVFSQKLVGAGSKPVIEANDPLPGTYNYFMGSDPARWHTHVHAFREVVYHDVWQGIDLKLYANGRNLEQEFIVHPGADPAQVRLAYEGIKKLDLAKNGSLWIHTKFGNLIESQPRLFQELEGKRLAVKGRFRISGDSYTFDVGHRNKELALVIDPTLLYSTFLGGSAGVSCGNPPFGGCGLSENATGIAVDTTGSAYVTGVTASPDFPVTTGALQTTFAPDCCAFVTKLSPLGDQLEYSTFIGGTIFSGAASNAIAVNALGEAYITGFAGTGYPITTNALEASFNGGIFFTKLSSQGDALLYSTQIGRAFIGFARGNAIAVDSSGKAYIAGSVDNGYSLDVTTGAFQNSFPPQAGLVAFLSVIDPTQSGRAGLFYSTYLGTSGADNGLGVALDALGMAYITGFANDPFFPVTPGAYQTTYAGGVDAFVAKINPNASGAGSLIYSTYLGASNEDIGSGIGVDALGNAYVVGFTNSGLNSPPFPTTPGALQMTYPGGGNSGFVTKLNPAGNQLVYSTYHGGFQGAPTSVAVDALGNAYVAGQTSGNFPVTLDAFQPVFRGGAIFRNSDAFVSKFGSDGSLIYSTFLGGGGGDGANAVAIDQIGDAYVTGFTTSPDFPTTISALQRTMNLSGPSTPVDMFVSKLPIGLPQNLSVTGMLPSVGGNTGPTTPQINGSGFHIGATAKLIGLDPEIPALNVNVSSGGRVMDATFDLSGSIPGTRSLVITNPDGSNITVPLAFTIASGGSPDIRTHKIGTKPVPGRLITYFITVENVGRIDSLDQFLSESLQPGLTLKTVNPPAVADVAAGNAESSIFWHFSRLAAGAAYGFSYQAAVDPATPVGSQVVGGPFCILSPSGIFQFSNCMATTTGAVPACSRAALSCGRAAVQCSPIQPLLLPATIPNPLFNPVACPFALASCITGPAPTCTSFVNSCLQVSAQNCTSLGSFVATVAAPPKDPNDLVGTIGVGSDHWVPDKQRLAYIASFENVATATASAQQVVVTDQLDKNLDWSSLRIEGLVIGDHQIAIPATFNPRVGLNEVAVGLDLRPSQNLLVNIDANLNPATGLVAWTFTSIDPQTGLVPVDASVGFLPPSGEATLFFTISPKESLPTGTRISDQAVIVFDVNAPISTPTWINTIDNTPPLSHVGTFPTTQSFTSFIVQWSGNDVGAGIQDFSVFVSDNGGPFAPFQTNTTETSATFTGLLGHTYGFYSIARDLVGNVESAKTVADATTTISSDAIPPTTVATAAPPANANGWNNSNVTIALTATDNPGGSGVPQITFNATGAQPIASTNAAGSSASALISTEGLTSFSFFATDLSANVEPTQTLTIKLDKTPPSITGTRTPLANANGWNNSDVTASFACADALSGLAPGSPPANTLMSTEGANQQVTGACQDLAGNMASATVSGINIDKTPPNIAPSRTPAANSNGWNNTNVTVSFACADALSGLAPGSPPAPSVLASEGVNQQVSGTCFDLAGNSASAPASGINIDKTPPALSGLPVAGCTLWPPDHRFVTVATISAVDLLSGLISFNVTGTSNEPQNANDPDIIITGAGLGPRTVQLRADRLGTGAGRIYTINTIASDAAGNVVNSTSTCTVPHDQGN
jgi:hypothetical protein